MTERILVTYASRAGSTSGVAEEIGKVLAESGCQVDVRPMQEVKDLTPYRAVVAGSAVRKNKWLPEAMAFVQTFQVDLAKKPCAAFMVCITLTMSGSEQHRAMIADWMAPVRRLVRPVSEGYFAGALDFSKLPFSLNKLLFRVSVLLRIFRQGDHRNWEAIRAWAAELPPLLAA